MKHKTIVSPIELSTAQAYIETITKRAGLTVRYDYHTKVPYTTGKQIVLPMLNTGVKKESITRLRYFILHECLHHIYGSGIFNLITKYKQNSILRSIINLLEDGFVETAHLTSIYSGDKAVLKNNLERNIDIYTNLIKKYENTDDENIGRLIGIVVYLLYIQENIFFNGRSPHDVYSSVMALNKKSIARNVFEKLLNKQGLIESVVHGKPCEQGSETCDSEKIGTEIFKYIFPEKPPEQEKKASSGQSGCGNKNKQENGNEQDSAENQNNSNDSSKNNKKNAQSQELSHEDGANKEIDRKAVTEVMYKPCNRMIDGTDQQAKQSMQGVGLTIKYDNHSFRNNFVPCTPKELITKHYKKHKPRKLCSWEIQEMNDSLKHVNKGFANKVRRELEIKARNRYKPKKKKGKLHGRTLYKLCRDKTSQAIDQSRDKIFRQKEVNDVLDCAITVLVDGSGSMVGSKIINATAACVMVTNALQKTLRIPIEVLIFSTNGSRNVLGICKDFTDKMSDKELATSMFRMFEGSANNDGDSLLQAYKRLKVRNEKKKILIVLSDGQPAAGRPGDAAGYLKEVVKEIESDKDIGLLSIGIQSSSVKHFYTKTRVIDHASEIETVLLDLLKKEIINN